MRSKNAIKTLTIYLTYEILVFVLSIIFPRFIILTYGSEINGLTSTITRILSFINLIQAGAVGSAIFQMYKPVAENDYDAQSKIMYASRKFYCKITIIYLIIALAAGIFYSFYLRNENLTFIEIFLSFLVLTINGAGVLLFNSLCDIFESAHQKKYYLIIAAIIEQIIRYGLLVFVLVYKLHFIFIYLCYLLGGVVSVVINLITYKKMSRGIITNSPSDKNYRIPDRKYLMLSSFGSELVTISPTIIITTVIDLVYSSIFSIYAMIFTSLKTILNSIQLSFSAIFGNLTKTSSDEKISSVHSLIELITLMVGLIVSSCAGFLIIPFIKLYTSGADVNYLFNNLSIFVVVYILIFAFRTSFSYISTVYGLFKDTCKITLFFGITGIIISLLCVLFFGMPYVMIGLLYNQAGCSVTTLLIIKKKVPWFRTKRLFIRSSLMFSFAALFTTMFFVLEPSVDGWMSWVLFGAILVFINIFIVFIYCILFERKYLKMLTNYIKAFFNTKRG